MLRNVISLKQFNKDDLSKENKYKCHGCEQEKVVSEEREFGTAVLAVFLFVRSGLHIPTPCGKS